MTQLRRGVFSFWWLAVQAHASRNKSFLFLLSKKAGHSFFCLPEFSNSRSQLTVPRNRIGAQDYFGSPLGAPGDFVHCGLFDSAAVIHAAGIRPRPIMMTTAAMVLGVVPFVLATGAASRFNMGLVIGSGLYVGTLFTVFVLPAVYLAIAARHAAPKAALAEAKATGVPPVGQSSMGSMLLPQGFSHEVGVPAPPGRHRRLPAGSLTNPGGSDEFYVRLTAKHVINRAKLSKAVVVFLQPPQDMRFPLWRHRLATSSPNLLAEIYPNSHTEVDPSGWARRGSLSCAAEDLFGELIGRRLD